MSVATEQQQCAVAGCRGRALLLAPALLAFVLCATAYAAEPTGCDRLAAHPSDPDKVVDGVSSGTVRGWNAAAIWACRQAVASEPSNPRVRYQLGRSLFYAGQKAEALEHLAAAAQAQHRQAQFVLGLMYTEGVDEILPADHCRALELWVAAASRGHFAARVALGRDLAREVYAACAQVPESALVSTWLEAARQETRDYYQGLLIDWTLEELDRSR